GQFLVGARAGNGVELIVGGHLAHRGHRVAGLEQPVQDHRHDAGLQLQVDRRGVVPHDAHGRTPTREQGRGNIAWTEKYGMRKAMTRLCRTWAWPSLSASATSTTSISTCWLAVTTVSSAGAVTACASAASAVAGGTRSPAIQPTIRPNARTVSVTER